MRHHIIHFELRPRRCYKLNMRALLNHNLGGRGNLIAPAEHRLEGLSMWDKSRPSQFYCIISEFSVAKSTKYHNSDITGRDFNDNPRDVRG